MVSVCITLWGPRISVLLVGGPGAQGILGLMPPLMSRAESWVLWLQGPGGGGLVPGYWCVGPCPGPSGGQDCIWGWLWAQGILRQPAWWWVGLA